jgi:hypothetical protein
VTRAERRMMDEVDEISEIRSNANDESHMEEKKDCY